VNRLLLPRIVIGAALAGIAGPGEALDSGMSLAPRGRQPRAAVGAQGLVAVVYGEGNQVFSRVSRDGGASYGEPTRVGELAQLMLGMRRGPQVAVVGSSLVVTAIGKEGDLVAWRSPDAGASWGGPATVNDSPTSAREGLHDLVAAAGGEAHVVWLDLRDQRTKIFTARSTDQGRTWGANRLVYESPERTVCECCQPTAAADGGGEVVFMWRNLVAGARDMFLVRSNDDGRTFGEARKLGNGSWPLKGCPMDGGGVAVSNGRVATVWRREETLFAAAPGSAEERLGPGRNAAVAFGPGGPRYAWQTPDGEIVLKEPGASAPVAVGRGKFPSFGAAARGQGPVVLVWEDPDAGVMTRPLP
jgi:hypothetical protein